MRDCAVIVAGLGAMGSATLAELARRGVRTLGIERFGIGHGHGSSGGDTRLIRKAYFEHPDYVPLLERAWQGWRALEAETGRILLHATGILYAGAPDEPLIGGSLRAAALHGLAVETLDATALALRFPMFRMPQDLAVVFEPEAGFVLAEAGVRAAIEVARARGAVLHTGERLLSWRADGSGVAVTTDRGRYRADRLVLTLGSWSQRLLGPMPFTLTVTRQTLFWTHPARQQEHALGRMPAWAVQPRGARGLYYGFPALDALHLADREYAELRPGVKLALHLPGATVEPDARLAPADVGEYLRVMQTVRTFLPGLDGPWSGAAVCRYTLSRDEHFIVEPHAVHPQVVYACGFSGHGFKFAPVFGDALADLAVQGATALPIAFLASAGREAPALSAPAAGGREGAKGATGIQ
ncbi:MAG: N-methyl-L-tryptophan oxidase [Pseudomonadales bacterium]|nr:N-methyl-L-tryptophan oxidase [Pseudomonadales bacterium]